MNQLTDQELTASTLERIASELLLEAKRIRAQNGRKRQDGKQRLKETLAAAKRLARGK